MLQSVCTFPASNRRRYVVPITPAQHSRAAALTASEDLNAAPSVGYWHVWTDGEGISHQSRGQIDDFEMASISSGAAAQWLAAPHSGAYTVRFTVLPPGWIGEWHENPVPQWIVPLSGRWAVETMDGQTVEMGVGEISFGNDKHTRDGQGHRSWTVGDEAAVLMLVQFGPEVPLPEIPKAP